MADTQASAFGDIPALDLTNDRIPILDVSATGNDKNKLISATTLMASKLNLAGGTLTGQLAISQNGAVSAPMFTLTGSLFTGGSATTTKPLALIEPAGTTSTNWNTSGTFLGINAPSGYQGNLLDLQIAGSRVTRVGYNSTLGHTNMELVNLFSISSTQGGRLQFGSSGNDFYVGTTSSFMALFACAGNGRLMLRSAAGLVWSGNSVVDQGVSTSVGLFRDGDGIMAQVNSTNAQKFRVYGTTTGSKYVQLEHDGTVALLSSSSGGLSVGAQSQNLSLYGKTPVAQATTALTGATYASLTGGAIELNDTFDGYTVAQAIKALINVGILA